MNNLVNELLKEIIQNSRLLKERGGKDFEIGKYTEKTDRPPPIEFPKFYINEQKWGTAVDTSDRHLIELIGAAMRGLEKDTPLDRVAAANKFMTEIDRNVSTRRAIGNLMFFDIFSSIVADFNASVAGFLFEGLFAGLFSGFQIEAKEGGGKWGTVDVALNIQREDGKYQQTGYSFKLLRPGGEIKGSFKDLVDGFAQGHTEEKYLVVYKEKSKEGELILNFWEFTINKDTWFTFIGHGKPTRQPTFKTKIFTLEDESFSKYMGKTPYKEVGGEWLARTRKNQAEWDTLDADVAYIPAKGKEGRFKNEDGSPIEPRQPLYLGKQYQVGVGVEHLISDKNIENSERFKKLYKDFLPGGSQEKWFKDYTLNKFEESMDFLTYMAGPYKSDDGFFSEVLARTKAAGAEKFEISSRAMEQYAKGPVKLKLSRKDFTKAAQEYTDIIGEHVGIIFNSLSSLVTNISAYYLEDNSSKRAEHSRTAQQKAGELKDNADKYITAGADERQMELPFDREKSGSGEVLQTLEPGAFYKVGRTKKPSKWHSLWEGESKQPIDLDKLIEQMIDKSFK